MLKFVLTLRSLEERGNYFLGDVTDLFASILVYKCIVAAVSESPQLDFTHLDKPSGDSELSF